MPTVLRDGPYRFFFYAGDGGEPRHVHVARGKGVAEFWLDPVRIQRSNRLRRPEILRVQHMIEANHKLLVEAWNDYLEN